MTKPLKWCIDWKNMSFKDKFLMDFPFIGINKDRVYKDIIHQLKKRDKQDLNEWKAFPEVSNLAFQVSAILKEENVWPSDLFLPSDPADIPFALYFDFTDKWDFLPIWFNITKNKLNVEMKESFWEGLSEITYVEAIVEIVKAKDKMVL